MSGVRASRKHTGSVHYSISRMLLEVLLLKKRSKVRTPLPKFSLGGSPFQPTALIRSLPVATLGFLLSLPSMHASICVGMLTCFRCWSCVGFFGTPPDRRYLGFSYHLFNSRESRALHGRANQPRMTSDMLPSISETHAL